MVTKLNDGFERSAAERSVRLRKGSLQFG